MNLFSDYQNKIFNSLKKLQKKNLLQIPDLLKSITVELPPQNQEADISCNVAMLLTKSNNKPPMEIAEILKRNFFLNA